MFVASINRVLLDECPFMDGATRRCLRGADPERAHAPYGRRKCRESDHESCIHFLATMLSRTRTKRVGMISEFAEK